jgi:hypothetical protein
MLELPNQIFVWLLIQYQRLNYANKPVEMTHFLSFCTPLLFHFLAALNLSALLLNYLE